MLIVDYLLVFQIGFFGAPEYVISCSFSIEFIKYSAKERKRLGLFEGLNTCPSINQGVIRMSRHSTENWVDLVMLPCKGTTLGVAGRAAAEEVFRSRNYNAVLYCLRQVLKAKLGVTQWDI
ncbi:uncharacterized protein LOC112526925 isoform X2 [Cynara cardunculus var. scolymus]|uniref:uncharacterized protein LOC112526925 isoform X2 n=1 Tax=Cynara cardunculus var. scolymus TaxID=59895 RepID=UPI000D62565D|nr:uncharacterized protein LOC112526925 isoform X2 [Cynara cardunculus var. scolymus]